MQETIGRRVRLAQIWSLAAVTILGVAVAVGAWIIVSIWEMRLARAEFEDTAGDYATVLQHGIDHYIGDIVGVGAFYDASVSVTQHEFELFTTRILSGQGFRSPYGHDHAERPHGSIMRITWSPYVPDNRRKSFVRAKRFEGLSDFTIKQWTSNGSSAREERRPEYFPVLFDTGASADPGLIGMDINSEPVRKNTIRRAIAVGQLATAETVTVRGTRDGDGPGLFAALPVYRNNVSHDQAHGRQDLIGILSGTFRTKPLIDSILDGASLPRTVDLYLFPADASGLAAPLYARQTTSSPKTPDKNEIEALPRWSAALIVGDRRLNLFVVPAEPSVTGYFRAWLVVALIGLIFAAVLAYMWASLRHTLRLETANRRILQLAQTDILTSLANRRAFMKRLKAAFAASLRGAPPFAVLYLDVDDFKDVNDTLGHAMGDELLKELVARLRTVVREEDLVARFGGDEFAILVSNVNDPADAGALAARIAEVLDEPFVINDHKISITSSIGIAGFSRDIAGPEAMMVQADLALYGAKDEGRNCYRFHSAELDRQVHERVRIAEELRSAVDDGEIELYYQPQVELTTGRVMGVEALVRWNHKTRGLLTPASFISVAERTGTVQALGNWIFDEACRQMRAWQADGVAPHVLAVNISGVQLKSAELEREVEASMARWDINPASMELELTESVLMEASQRHGAMLKNLRNIGLRIAVDDFGTGYSSLKYLTAYPVNRLKLAQEFVFRVTLDYRNAAVVRAAIRLAHELGIDVIAEGVETEAQMRFLIGAGCEEAQGYLFSRPVPAAQMTAILREGRVAPAPAAQGSKFTSAA